MSLRYSLAGGELLGRREDQEDFHLLRWPGSGGGRDPAGDVPWADVVVADGMGGHSAGEIASAQASVAFLRAVPADAIETRVLPDRLFDALDRANDAISAWIHDYPATRGMGCTLVGARLGEEGLSWISVGDSPLYLFRDGALRQVNADHSFASVLKERVEAGEMDAAEAAVHPQRNQLLSALVGEEMELIDLSPKPLALEDGDLLIFATDGILTLDETTIAALLAEASVEATSNDAGETASAALPEHVVQRLLAAVTDAGLDHQDNTTLVAVRCSAAA